ncbi:MAG: hypothetical protein AAGG02_04040 [Cyanobacteria bacterium P01_H01_bin.15]
MRIPLTLSFYEFGYLEQAIVRRDSVVEVKAPDLAEGQVVEVIVLTESSTQANAGFSQFIGSAQGCYESPADVDRFIQQERESWDS